jgi:hypothetical protein
MRSHSILRTNVALTTNAKIVVDSNYRLFVDTIISVPELSQTKYRRREFTKENYLDEVIPYFFGDTTPEIAFGIRDANDNDNMSSDFSNQYDDLYEYGARNIIENKDYTEEFEYFAPLYVTKGSLPSNFIIFRVDGPGITRITASNFRSQILSKLKFVKNFDLGKSTALGQFLDRSITRNKNFPVAPLYIDFRDLEFSYWIGIDYESGGYSEKSNMLGEFLEYEQTYHDFEKFITDGYKNNKLIFPHIINFSFLFDDTPATPVSLRKWSLNRYMGFYLDSLEFVTNVSPYILPKLRTDVTIDSNNILSSASGQDIFEVTWKKEENPFIEIGGYFYKIEKYLEAKAAKVARVQIGPNTFEDMLEIPTVNKWKIISDKNLAGRESEINKNLIKIETINSENLIKYSDGSDFIIDNFDDADVWLIEIAGFHHNIVKNLDGKLILNTDYAFVQSDNKFTYFINQPNKDYEYSIDLIINEYIEPVKFKISRCKFTDIKDFDLSIVDTDFAKHEYIVKDELTETDEAKLYSTNYLSKSIPVSLDEFKLNGSVVSIPAASEYTANSETFRLVNDELTTLWRKNSQRVKWGYQRSISGNDYPYLLNNSIVSDDFNRTVNTIETKPNRLRRNLDYFLTINPDSDRYLHHSLHVEDKEVTTYKSIEEVSAFISLVGISNISQFSIDDKIEVIENGQVIFTTSVQDITNNLGVYSILTYESFTSVSNVGGQVINSTRRTFNLDRYLNKGYDLDYFSYFFGKKSNFDNGLISKNTKKYSYFDVGDGTIPNSTLFRGIKFSLSEVDSVKADENSLSNINIVSSNKWEGYKFAVLLSRNNFQMFRNIDGTLNLQNSVNSMKWQTIENWQSDKTYVTGSIVKFFDILYKASRTSYIFDPEVFPHNSLDWTFYRDNSIFWCPVIPNNMQSWGLNNLGVQIPPLVSNSDEYYYSDGTTGNTFWNPSRTYNPGDVILYDRQKWLAVATNSFSPPDGQDFIIIDEEAIPNWEITASYSTIWSEVELWDATKEYNTANSVWASSFARGHYVVYEDIVWVTISDPVMGVDPPLEPKWIRVYSLVQDTEFVYGSSFENSENPIVEMNNRLYRCVSNDPNRISRNSIQKNNTLDNGITIFVNKKWKNVLVNIYVNDNTYTTVRDEGINDWKYVRDFLSNTNRDDIYTELFEKICAKNFMEALNDPENKNGFSDAPKYVVIEEDLTTKIWSFDDLTNISDLPVLLTCESPDPFEVFITSRKITPLSVPQSQIKAQRQLDEGNITSLSQLNWYDNKNLAITSELRVFFPERIPNFSKLKNFIYFRLFRHSGYYSPIFTDIELFQAPELNHSGGNYKFDTILTNFGKIRERLISKVSRKGNILKLRDQPDLTSVYPMLDEFGYTVTDFFIFKSTWDFDYHIECEELPQSENTSSNQSINYNPNVVTPKTNESL